MARRNSGKMDGERFLGNTNTNQVHDLDNEQTGSNECQINEIIAAGHDVPYKTLAAAHGAGFENCDFCL